MKYLFDYMIEEKEPIVICGVCALARSGLVTDPVNHLDLFMSYPEIHGLALDIVTYYYNPKTDTVNYIKCCSPDNEKILLPTVERALVEYIQFIDDFPELQLVEGLQEYLFRQKDDLSKLYEVANFYGLDRKTLDYWISEAREWETE